MNLKNHPKSLNAAEIVVGYLASPQIDTRAQPIEDEPLTPTPLDPETTARAKAAFESSIKNYAAVLEWVHSLDKESLAILRLRMSEALDWPEAELSTGLCSSKEVLWIWENYQGTIGMWERAKGDS